MILALIGVAALVVGIVLAFKFEFDIPSFIYVTLIVIGTIATIVCSFCIASANICPDARVAELEAKREAIVYQLENRTYINANNVGTFELMDQIAEFNGTIEAGRVLRNNPWTSWCTSKAWMYVEPIDIEGYQN